MNKLNLFLFALLFITLASAYPLQLIPNGSFVDLLDHNTTINGTPVDLIWFNNTLYVIQRTPDVVNFNTTSYVTNITNITYLNSSFFVTNITNITNLNTTCNNCTQITNVTYSANYSNLSSVYLKSDIDNKFGALGLDKYALKTDIPQNVTQTIETTDKTNLTLLWVAIGFLLMILIFLFLYLWRIQN